MLYFDIKRYSINDGPGIRVTVFMKGCPLSCVWCHNPEGISSQKQKMYTQKKCIGCKRCVTNCPSHALTMTHDGIISNNALCHLCGQCATVCPSLAMAMCGKDYSVNQLMYEIEKERVFMDNSGGGVTFSGGEPLLFPEMLLELLLRCKAIGVHRAVDTALYAQKETVATIMKETDLFLVDLKLMDADKHKAFCGVSNELILSNLRFIAEAGKAFYIRIPLIEGINAHDDNITHTAEFLASLPWKQKVVHILPYHEIALGKHQKLGTIPVKINLKPPSLERQQQCIEIFKNFGMSASVGG